MTTDGGQFPSNDNLKQQWISKLNRPDWTPTKYTKICSCHFNDADFIVTKKGLKKLKKGTLPSLKLDLSLKRKLPEPVKSSVDPTTSDLDEFLILNDSPRKKKLKQEIEQLRYKEKKTGLKIRRLQMQVKRLKKKVRSSNAVIKELESKHLLQGEDAEILSSINIKMRDLVGRQISKIKKLPLKKKYSPALRSFALSLYYYSPNAYSYVRKTFDTCLPHPRTISKWYETVDGEAGFTAEAFKILNHKKNVSGKHALCSLMMDEIAIKKHVEWDGNKYHGYVDLGLNDIQKDNSEQASQALVLLLSN
ncbi:hypothetical protein evm_013578 [Chilo suppressalis]|nr:hypothetical protein evm_013578 [Chilo suppressalis]